MLGIWYFRAMSFPDESNSKAPRKSLPLIELVAGGGLFTLGGFWTVQSIVEGSSLATIATNFVIAAAGLGVGYLTIRPIRLRAASKTDYKR
jgi:hypothetical protein